MINEEDYDEWYQEASSYDCYYYYLSGWLHHSTISYLIQDKITKKRDNKKSILQKYIDEYSQLKLTNEIKDNQAQYFGY